MERVRRTRGEDADDRPRRARQPDIVTAEEVVHVTVSGVGDKDKQKVLAVRKFVTEPASVRVSAGTTKSMGNYEFLRVDVSISYPCYREEIDAVIPVVAEKVAVFLQDEIDNYLEA